jgi:hypothetical protein
LLRSLGAISGWLFFYFYHGVQDEALQNPHPPRLLQDFHIRGLRILWASAAGMSLTSAKDASASHLGKSRMTVLHKIQFKGMWTACTPLQIKGHTVVPFSLTLKIEGVKQTRSSTASEVFLVGAASGAQAKVTLHIAK